MESPLNPEAPEFHPSTLDMVTQDGYEIVKKSINSVNKMPFGTSYELYKTFSDFIKITTRLSDNIISQANNILSTGSLKLKLRSDDIEENTEKIIDANDFILDRLYLLMFKMNGEPSSSSMKNSNLKEIMDPAATTIQVSSKVVTGAEDMERPQLHFKDVIDNSANLWIPKITDKPNNIKPLALEVLYDDDGNPTGYEHPYQTELDLFVPSKDLIEPDKEALVFPLAVESTDYTYVSTEDQVNSLVEHLNTVTEIAVDVEHHSYRSYQGFTCLIQITTSGGDFIIDAIAVREHLHKLNLSFTNPKILKVFHGAVMDVQWLQRDFGVYIVGLFDTYEAAKVLNLSGLSLQKLLFTYCSRRNDKKYQLADWRIRPLPAELIHYARMDTHYLLYIYHCLKDQLLNMCGGKPDALLSVYEASRQTCKKTYVKRVTCENSYYKLYLKSERTFTFPQLEALQRLYQWRDKEARNLDESTEYIMSDRILLNLAEFLPEKLQAMDRICVPMTPFLLQNLATIHDIILNCRWLTCPQKSNVQAKATEDKNENCSGNHTVRIVDTSNMIPKEEPVFHDPYEDALLTQNEINLNEEDTLQNNYNYDSDRKCLLFYQTPITRHVSYCRATKPNNETKSINIETPEEVLEDGGIKNNEINDAEPITNAGNVNLDNDNSGVKSEINEQTIKPTARSARKPAATQSTDKGKSNVKRFNYNTTDYKRFHQD